MKEYLVEIPGADWNNIYIVSAKNAKDAINQVFTQCYKERNTEMQKENKEAGEALNYIFARSKLTARSISSIHNEEGKVICEQTFRC